MILQHFEDISMPATNHGVFVTFGKVSDPFQLYHLGFLPSRVTLVPNILKCLLKQPEPKTRIWMQLSFLWSEGERLGNKGWEGRRTRLSGSTLLQWATRTQLHWDLLMRVTNATKVCSSELWKNEVHIHPPTLVSS